MSERDRVRSVCRAYVKDDRVSSIERERNNDYGRRISGSDRYNSRRSERFERDDRGRGDNFVRRSRDESRFEVRRHGMEGSDRNTNNIAEKRVERKRELSDEKNLDKSPELPSRVEARIDETVRERNVVVKKMDKESTSVVGSKQNIESLDKSSERTDEIMEVSEDEKGSLFELKDDEGNHIEIIPQVELAKMAFPYFCEECRSLFAAEDDLVKHEKIYHYQPPNVTTPQVISEDFCKECRVKGCGETFKTRYEYNWRRHMLVHLPKGNTYNKALEAFVRSQTREADNCEDSQDVDMETVIPPVNLVAHTSSPIFKDAVECKVTDKVVSGSDGEFKSYSVIPRWAQEVSTYKVKGQKKTLHRHTTYYHTIFWPKDLPPPPPIEVAEEKRLRQAVRTTGQED